MDSTATMPEMRDLRATRSPAIGVRLRPVLAAPLLVAAVLLAAGSSGAMAQSTELQNLIQRVDRDLAESFGLDRAAGALVTPGKRVGKGELWAGSPAKRLRDLSAEEQANLPYIADHYAELTLSYLDERRV